MSPSETTSILEAVRAVVLYERRPPLAGRLGPLNDLVRYSFARGYAETHA